MTLREELEILRGEPIEVFDGDPMDIPCIEQSDIDQLCKSPVVSVQMCTYNHEPYIRQAIEGVMMQKTDFEFELVIGEDCSQDNTREICFEYQRKYPDKIRVLWWHENVFSMGGNSRRVRAHCRGDYIALCEGDDYWIDPHKLQKQYDIFHKYPSVAIVFGYARVLYQTSGRVHVPQIDSKYHGLLNGRHFFHEIVSERQVSMNRVDPDRLRTPTAMINARALHKVLAKYGEIFSWKLYLGDTTQWLALSSIGDVYFLPEELSVYRRHLGGISSSRYNSVMRDATIVKMYFCVMYYRYSIEYIVCYFREELFLYWMDILNQLPLGKRISRYRSLRKVEVLKIVFMGVLNLPYRIALLAGISSPWVLKWLNRYYYRVASLKQCLMPQEQENNY